MQEIRESQALPPIFGLLLALGNHLNGGSSKGQADGFALEDLGKMSVFKDNSNESNLLEYAIQVSIAPSCLVLRA